MKPHPAENKRCQATWPVLVAIIMVAVALSPTGQTHTREPNTPGEGYGFEWPPYPQPNPHDPLQAQQLVDLESQFELWLWTFDGKPDPIAPDTPCTDATYLDHDRGVEHDRTYYGTGVGPEGAGGPGVPGQPHLGHIFAARYLPDYDEKRPDDTTKWTWIPENGVMEWHLDGYEDHSAFEGDWTQNAPNGESVLLGTDGYITFHFGRDVADVTGPDIGIVDYHPTSSYCIWAKPSWAIANDPWLFVGSSFIERQYDWDFDGQDDFPQERGLSMIDLELFYDKLLRERYAFVRDDEPATAYKFLVQASLDKYPAVLALWDYDVVPFADQTSAITPPEQKNNGPLGIRYKDPDFPTSTIDIDWQYDRKNPEPIVQEHWIDLEAKAIRYGHPAREDIMDNSADPLYAWEWYIDSDPDPNNSNAFVARECPGTYCTPDFPFPNPYRLPEPPQEFYLDEPWIDGQDGSYQVCLFVYTDEAVGPTGKAPDMMAFQNGDPDALQNADKSNSDMECHDIIVTNIAPVPLVKEWPVWQTGDPLPRTRTFLAEPWDPDSVPECVDMYAWDFDGEWAWQVAESDTGHTYYPQRFTPTYTFEKDGLVEVIYKVRDCNGLWSDPRHIYLNLPENKPPVLDPIGNQRIQVGSTWCHTVSGYDPEGYPIDVLTHSGVPAGMSASNLPTGNTPFEICWTPTIGEVGTYANHHFWIRDDLGAVGEEFVTFTVYVPEIDSDKDGLTDDRDNCPAKANTDQADSDNDGIGDVCDQPIVRPQLKAPGAEATASDIDRDGIEDVSDNCPLIPNKTQADLDNDGLGDKCDGDLDGDGIPQASSDQAAFLDNCPRTPNAGQEDVDENGVGDACDENTQFAANVGPDAPRGCGDECDEQATLERQFWADDAPDTRTPAIVFVASLAAMVAVLVPLILWARSSWKQV